MIAQAAFGRRRAIRKRGRRRAVSPALVFLLRQVVAERSEDHVLIRVRLTAGGDRDGSATHTAPGVAVDVGVLHAVLEGSLRALVEAIPEPERAFEQVPCITRAVGQRTGNESGGTADAG